jgi:lipoprotein-anchoring transpeptidase ErfK/SrfK
MNDDELGRRLTQAFDAETHARIDDHVRPPAPRFAAPRKRSRARLLAPLAAAAVVASAGISVLAVHQFGGRHAAVHRPATSVAAPVHIRMVGTDRASYGVGMPVVAYFSRSFTSAAELSAATSITVNGKPAHGAWYFERSAARGHPVVGHFRLPTYWPAHARIHLTLATRGVSAGPGLRFADAASVDFSTGPKTVAIVDDAKHRMIVTVDGKPIGSYPVSLGAAGTPTSRGIKVIMDKGRNICMAGPGYSECGIKYTQQLTYGGEYLHAAPWNVANIKRGVDTSNGCTNLLQPDARRLSQLLNVGDVVEYPDASGPVMSAGAGYGDWNVPWPVWLRGGLIPTS